MAPRPRKRSNTGLPLNVYENRTAYSWRHPITGKTFGLGNDRQYAFAQAHEANMAVLGLLDKPRLVHRITGAPDTLADWLEIYKSNQSQLFNEGKIAKSTKVTIAQRCNVISEAIGGLILKQITTRHIADFLKEYNAKERMQQAMRSLLQDVFRTAIEEGWRDANPVEATRSKRVETKRSRLSLEQFMLIHAEAVKSGPEWLPRFMELSILTGQRRGDVAKMLYRDIEGEFLNVKQLKNKRTNMEGHNVAIPLELSVAGFNLVAAIASTRNVVSRFLIHHNKQQGKARIGGKIRETTIALEFAKARLAAGVIMENPPTPHEIRSLSARLYAEIHGEAFAQALLGHHSDKMAALYQDKRDGWFRPKIAK